MHTFTYICKFYIHANFTHLCKSVQWTQIHYASKFAHVQIYTCSHLQNLHKYVSLHLGKYKAMYANFVHSERNIS